MIGRVMAKAVLAMITMLAFGDSDIRQGSLGAYTQPAKVTYIETSAKQQRNELIFGNLVMELPDGVTANMKLSAKGDEKDGQIVILSGAEELVGDTESYNGTGPFAPKIRIAHYTAEYERKETLISALLDLFPSEGVTYKYIDEENDEYVIFMMEPHDYIGTRHYVIVSDTDLYIIEEFHFESRYSFSALWRQGKVKWSDSGKMAGEEQDIDGLYVKYTPQEGISFICRNFEENGNNSVCFYLDGYFDNDGYMTYATDRKSCFYKEMFTDINFDGHTDIDVRNGYTLIWDSEEKSFVEVEYPDDMPNTWHMESFSEEGTIWGYEVNYLFSNWSDENKDYIQTFWRWEGFTPVKIRECREESREDGVRLWAYGEGADDIIFDESFTWDEWNSADERIYEVYGQFYDGLAPADFYAYEEAEEIIPQELLDKLNDAMMSGTEFETIETMLNFTELTNKEIYAYAEDSDDIRINVLQSYDYGGSFAMARVDVDNDGIEDIIEEYSDGGTGGFVDYILFKGQADGTYRQTDSFPSTREEFGVINYKGKNYLIRVLCDYGKKLYDGLCVTVYEDGIYTEEAYLMLYAEDYNLTLSFSDEKYNDFANEVMQSAADYYEKVDAGNLVMGSAEEDAGNNTDWEYACDLDNDGELEYYNKYIFTAANMVTTDGILYSSGDDEGSDLIRDVLDSRNTIMFWADDVDGETVVSVMYTTGLKDFELVGYVIDDAECREVYKAATDAVYGVKQTRSGREG